jgi:NTE family protein
MKMHPSLFSLILSALTFTWGPAAQAAEPEVLVPSSQVSTADLSKLKTARRSNTAKIGLALGGGGSRGAAEIGVLEVLEKEGLHFDYIVGTSIGSIIGGLYDAGVPIAKLREEFESCRAMKHFMPVPLAEGIMLEPVMLSARLVGSKSFDGLYPGYMFRKYLEKITPADAQDIQSLKTPYAAVSLNLVDGKPYMIRGGSLAKAMRASSAVPGLRKPVQFGDKLLVDGGVACNVPVKQCREMGADIVIAVNIDEPFDQVEVDKFRKFGSVTKRMVKWDLYSIDKPQEDLADIVIHPDTSGVTLVTTNRKEARKAIEAGRKAAEAAMPQIREKLKGLNAVAQKEQPATREAAVDAVPN